MICAAPRDELRRVEARTTPQVEYPRASKVAAEVEYRGTVVQCVVRAACSVLLVVAGDRFPERRRPATSHVRQYARDALGVAWRPGLVPSSRSSARSPAPNTLIAWGFTSSQRHACSSSVNTTVAEPKVSIFRSKDRASS